MFNATWNWNSDLFSFFLSVPFYHSHFKVRGPDALINCTVMHSSSMDLFIYYRHDVTKVSDFYDGDLWRILAIFGRIKLKFPF